MINLTYYRIELRRLWRDGATMFFTIGLPAFFYLIFGAAPDYGSEPIRDGNVAMWVMIAMAAYGAVTATAGIGSMSALERLQGWARQLGLTPMTDAQYVAVKALVAVTIAAGPIVIIYGLGALTGAAGPLSVWLASGLLLLAGALTFALYGLGFGLLLRSEAAMSAAGGSLVILSFLGNIFVPLTGWQLTLAKFTPLYGYVALARRPLTGGATLDPRTGDLTAESIWPVLANVAGWTMVLALTTVWLVQRGRSRQA